MIREDSVDGQPYDDGLDDAPCRRGEFVNGLGWSCITHDTFGCPDAQRARRLVEGGPDA